VAFSCFIFKEDSPMADDNPQGGNPAEALQKLLDKKNGDAMAVSLMLLSENFDLRSKNRELRDKVPADGSVVLKKEDADRLAAFDALKLKPEEVTAKLQSVTELEGKIKGHEKDGALRSVSEAGWKFSVLKDFDTLEGGLEYLVKDETKDGKTTKIAYVKADGKERPLEEYAKEKRPDLLPAMQAGETKAGGTPWPKQDAGGKAPAGNFYDQIRKDADDRQKAGKETSLPLTERKGLTVIGAA
jgi:hypothetical protein